MPTFVVIVDDTRYETEASSEAQAKNNVFSRIVGYTLRQDGYTDVNSAEYKSEFKIRKSNLQRDARYTVYKYVRLKIGVVGSGNLSVDNSHRNALIKSLRGRFAHGIEAIYIPEQKGLPDAAREFAHGRNITLVELHPEHNSAKPFISNVSRIADECDIIYVPLLSLDDDGPELSYLKSRLHNINKLGKLSYL